MKKKVLWTVAIALLILVIGGIWGDSLGRKINAYSQYQKAKKEFYTLLEKGPITYTPLPALSSNPELESYSYNGVSFATTKGVSTTISDSSGKGFMRLNFPDGKVISIASSLPNTDFQDWDEQMVKDLKKAFGEQLTPLEYKKILFGITKEQFEKIPGIETKNVVMSGVTINAYDLVAVYQKGDNIIERHRRPDTPNKTSFRIYNEKSWISVLCVNFTEEELDEILVSLSYTE